ncbi:hypothetical protein KSS87_016199 [Heliosperma pusillum]|nr:hypothetical protein KSS87_016199 [Heliosperma pusillum]
MISSSDEFEESDMISSMGTSLWEAWEVLLEAWEILETAFKKETIGLVTREEYVEKRVTIKTKIEEEEKDKLHKIQAEEARLEDEKRKKKKRKTNFRLSFSQALDQPEHDEETKTQNLVQQKCAKLGKDPTVETSFLPDSEREAEEQAERERLKRQWVVHQQIIKNEPFQITYSYWDGRGHRRVRKGDTIGAFLRAVQLQLSVEFREVRTTSVENLLYVKEDLIIPHQHSFYELIINKARGKSGPCPQKPGSYECGYYVMKWMYDITLHYASSEDDIEKCISGTEMNTELMNEV